MAFGGALAVQRAVMLGGWAAVQRTRRLQATPFGGMPQCGVVREEGGSVMDNAGVVGRSIWGGWGGAPGSVFRGVVAVHRFCGCKPWHLGWTHGAMSGVVGE
jgi:hypothetical protein